MTRVKVGIIGLGEVAQIIHLPILASMDDRFEIAAICDISPSLLRFIGERYRVPEAMRFTDAESLCAVQTLDAVFVLNSDEYHTAATLAALRRKKHVLLEKPMCLTLADADAIIRARDEAGTQVMIGYMRRYAPAFTEAVELVRNMGPIRYARVRDLIGPNGYFIGQSSRVFRPTDIPEEAMAERKRLAAQQAAEAIGDAPADLVSTYRLLNGLSSHDLSAMRELIGMPNRVISAAQWNGGSFIHALFEFDGFNATFETGIHRIGRFDAHLEVYSDAKAVKVQYNTPYIRHLPTVLMVDETDGDAFSVSETRPTFKDPYTVEIETFHDVVTRGLVPKTTPEDAKQDLILFRWIIDAIRRNG